MQIVRGDQFDFFMAMAGNIRNVYKGYIEFICRSLGKTIVLVHFFRYLGSIKAFTKGCIAPIGYRNDNQVVNIASG